MNAERPFRSVFRSKSVRLAFLELLHQKWYLLGIVLTIPLETMSRLAFPYFLNLVIQRGMHGEILSSHIAGLIILPVVSTIVSGLIFSLKDQMNSYLEIKLEGALREKILNLPPFALSAVY